MNQRSLEVALSLCVPFVGRDPTRDNLSVINVEAGRIWATDGHRAIVVTREQSSDQVGQYTVGSKSVITPLAERDRFNVPNIDAVLPAKMPSLALELSAARVQDLRSAYLMFVTKADVTVVFSEFGTVTLRCLQDRGSGKNKTTHRVALGLRGKEWPALKRTHKNKEALLGLNFGYLMDVFDATPLSDRDGVQIFNTSDMDPAVTCAHDVYTLTMPVRV